MSNRTGLQALKDFAKETLYLVLLLAGIAAVLMGVFFYLIWPPP